MKVSCPACDSKYTIADEKVLGRKVKVRCKSCGGQILINGTIPPPAPDPNAASEDDNGPDEATHVFTGAERKAFDDKYVPASKSSPESAPKSAPSQGTPEADDGITWSVNVAENDERSLSTREVVDGFLSGEFAGEVYVWHDGMTDWAVIPDVPQLAAAVEAAKKRSPSKSPSVRPPDASPAPKQKQLPSIGKAGKTAEHSATSAQPDVASKKTAARVAGAKRPQSAHDLFAAASAAGSELDVPVSDDEEAAQKKTGARNENSVLFSLDALKAGITASPAQQPLQKAGPGKKAPATPRKKLEDIMVDAGSPLAAGPIGSPLMLSANQSLLTAPAPPPPKPKPEPVVAPPEGSAAAAAAISYAKEKEKTKRMLIGVIAGIVVVGAIAGLAIGMTKSKEPAPLASSKSVETAPMAAAEPPKAPEKPNEAAPTPSPAESAAPSASAAASPQKSPSGTPGAGKVVGTGTATAPKVEPKKEPKKEEPSGPVSTGVASFNKDAASQALSVAASQTSICKKPDGPTGQGKVQVTFAPSGRATTANIVSGPFGGTAVGGCVSGVFKRARVPAFSGDPVTVSKSFSITQ